MNEIERISDIERSYVNEVLNNQFRTSAGSKMNTRLEKLFQIYMTANTQLPS